MSGRPSPATVSKHIDFDRFPRVALCHQPTPIEPMHRLSEYLGGPSFFIKRDDCTGLATGGNKTRKLEFLAGEAIEQNADMLVTQGAVQSNHVRQTAAAACRLGLKCHSLLERRVPPKSSGYERTGNVFLDRLFGTSLEFREPGLDMNAEALRVTERLRDEGHRPYFIPGGGSNEVGALGYASCAQEIVQQGDDAGQAFSWLIMATGSTGTQAGLVAGFRALDSDLPVIGVSVRQAREKQRMAVQDLAVRTLAKIEGTEVGSDRVPGLDNVIVDDGYVGEGYGIPANSTLKPSRWPRDWRVYSWIRFIPERASRA